jgi:hypothetical protein
VDLLTDTPLLLALLVLSLADGLSVGTLLIPLFLLIAPGRVRTGRIVLYLATIAAFYLAVGMLLMLGLVNLIEAAGALISSTGGQIALLILGVALLVVAIAMPTRRNRGACGARGVNVPPGRLVRWQTRMLDPRTTPLAVVAVAVTAGTLEITGMLPYLIGMTMIANEPVSLAVQYALLTGYCIVMVLPALVLLVARVLAARLVERPLERFAAWMQRTGTEYTAWLLGIAGFFISRGAATQLGLFGS